ncbi:thioredoxin 1 [Methylophilus rhizosphaerae]|uniref:Thioredoxin 1 n=1 Tax=Methylophilus rhizosphaerae TaxID=492660 RepID=A0A1G8ZFL5_9PROT|nr:thioredoxin family protein [Methylophilus rhizosphaerae]SDK13205.1 thioredoxin 1 [Methylophilus rhizosphaerae]
MNTEPMSCTPVTIGNQSQFNHWVTANDFLVLLFTAKWCHPCQPFAVVFTEVAGRYPQILFAVADIDVATDLTANFQVRQVPALMVIRERVVVDMVTGAMHAHELNHHVQMWQALDMASMTAHFEQKMTAGK